MLLNLLVVLLWLPALLGWGIGCRAFLAVGLPVRRDDAEANPGLVAMFGFLPLAIICPSLHLFIPLTGSISVGALLVGYVLFAYYRRRLGDSFSREHLIGALLIALLVSLFASRPLRHFDTGLYHVQSVKWCTEYPLVRGLANLHERLAFNSLWTPLSAVIDFPRFGQGAFFPITCFLFFAFGWAAYVAACRVRRRSDRVPEIFLAACGCFWMWLLISDSALVILPSLSTDAPIYFTSFLCVYFLLRFCVEADKIDLVQALAIAALAVTIKVSAAPLFAFLLLLAASSSIRNRNGFRTHVHAWSPVALLSGLLFCIWILRSVWMSGYLIFPIPSTALTSLPWHLPVPMAEQLVETLQAWARRPGVSPEIVLSSSAWMRSWLLRLLDEEIFYSALAYAAFGGAMLCAAAWQSGSKRVPLAKLWPAAALLLIGLIYWFFTAPDPRYGYGYLFAIAALVFSAGISSVLARNPHIAAIILFSAALTPLITVKDISHIRLTGLPPMGSGRSVNYTTAQGITIHVAGGDQRILNGQLPSTPYFRPGLLTEVDPHGRIVQFRLPKAVHTPYYGIRSAGH